MPLQWLCRRDGTLVTGELCSLDTGHLGKYKYYQSICVGDIDKYACMHLRE